MKIKNIGKTIFAAMIGTASVVSYPPTIKESVNVANKVAVDTLGNKKTLNIAVIDEFIEEIVPIDYDLRSDVPHGFVVSKIISDGLPNANVRHLNLRYEDNFDAKSPFKKLINDINNGQKCDAINISMGTLTSFKELSKKVQREITPDNIKENKKCIRNYLKQNPNVFIKTNPDSISCYDMYNILCDLDTLSSKGVKIYIAGGNSGNSVLNLFSLADSVNVVGSLDNLGRKSRYSANNALVNKWSKDELPIIKTDRGYSFTGGKTTDVFFSQTTGLFKIPKRSNLRGTSFATPKALVQDMKRK